MPVAGELRIGCDLLNLGMAPASLAVFGSNEPFNQWQLHSGELIALLTAKDFE